MSAMSLGSMKLKIVNRHTVHHDERIGGAAVGKRSDAADADRRIAVDAAVGSGYGKARHGTLQGAGHVLNGAALHHAGNVYSGDGARKVGFLLCAVAHDYELVELFGGGLQVGDHTVFGGHLKGLVAYVADAQHRAGGYLDSEAYRRN